VTRDELTRRDEALLHQAHVAALRAIDGEIDAPYSPAWGPQYRPLEIIQTTEDIGVFDVALVNIRIAMNPGESWGKCANCARLYLVEAYHPACSPECFTAHANFLENPRK